MNRNLLRISIAIVGILLLTLIVLGLSDERGAASPPNPEATPTAEPASQIISNRAAETQSGSSANIWTREMMLAAQPYPLEIIQEAPAVSLSFPKPDGPPGLIPGSPPEGGPQTLIDSNKLLTASQTAISGYNYPPPFVRYQNFDSYQVYPYSTIGVMFFKRGGSSFRCSAASIGDNAIWTAGHCIHAGDGELDKNGNVIDQGTWSTNVIFVPGYRNGNAPFGVWQAEDYNLKTTPEWFVSRSLDLRYDIGGAVLNLNGGQRLSQVVGSLGFAYNMDNSLHWTNIAYPSDFPFNGFSQQICAGSFAYADTSQPAPFPVAMGCDMTRGSSGGPWILDFSGTAGGSNFLNGNNSYRYPTHPNELFSPYFDLKAKSLWDGLDTTN
jgi:V8-like Glu-specific endopeptidase